MKYEISDTLYQEIQDVTDVDYERVGKDIPVANIESIIKDLLYEYHNLEEKYEELGGEYKDYRAVSYNTEEADGRAFEEYEDWERFYK